MQQKPLPSVGPTVAGGSGSPPAGGGAAITLPLPSTPGQPSQPAGQNQPPDPPDLSRPYRGWYPRWWLLSAFLCALLMGIVESLHALPCDGTSDFAATGFCQVTLQLTSWVGFDDWRQIVALLLIALVFVGFWLVTFLFGVTPIEIKRSRGWSSRFVSWCSQFRSITRLLYIYSVWAVFALIIMYWQNNVPTPGFALCAIILFVANSNFFHKETPLTRRAYLMGYALLALGCILFMWRVNRWQLTILVGEIALVLVGMWALISSIRLRREIVANPPLTPNEQLAQLNEDALGAGEHLRSLLGSFRPRKRP